MSTSFNLVPEEEQLARALRERLREGAWNRKLPGIAKLVREFGVSRTLMAKALILLRDSGEISHPGPRKAMRVNPGIGRTRGEGTLIVHSHVEKTLPTATGSLFAELQATMPRPVVIARIDNGGTPEEIFKTIHGFDAGLVLLLDHTGAMADRLTEAGRRVIAIGGIGHPKRAPSIFVSYEALVRGAFRKAFEAGHRRVTLPVWPKSEKATADLRRCVAEEYERAGLRHLPDFDTPAVVARTPEALENCLREIFRHTPPTALIINDTWQWYGAVGALGKFRLRVPEDISTILLTEMAELTAYRPTQAHFRHPVKEFTKEIRRILRLKHPETAGPTGLDPAWVPGGSLAAPGKPGTFAGK